ncbi:VOC family protein [Nocardiopsis sp. NPDC049922]|uniref:VOC family protein n=1 Tax=Nocardiopsis sp. NPDC049922 TaxID=3155157 RepID=UPI0034059110
MSENSTAEIGGTPEIDRTVYPMPMFATFRVADLAAAEAFYHAVGFVSLATIPGPDGSPVLVHLRRTRYQDLLLVPGEPERGSATVSFNAAGQDLAELAEALRAAAPEGARIEGPTDTAWFTSDLTVDDPDGNRVVLTAHREADMERAKEWAATFEGDFVVEDRIQDQAEAG